MRKKLHFKFNLLVMLMLLVASATKAQDVTAVWDFQNNLPEGIINTNIQQGKTNSVVSTVDSVLMYVMAQQGKLVGRQTDAQFNQSTILMIPVKSTRDVVTVTSYPGYHNYTVGGEAATEDVTVHRATSAEVKNGVVMVIATATSYLYSIKVVQAGAIQEKRLYSTSFTDWDEVDRKAASDVIVQKKTLYSKETLSFVLNGVGIYPKGTQSKFSPNVTGYMQTAKYTSEYKTEEPNAVTSALASITKITLHQAATGGNRGIKVSVKGDGDTDWVAIHNVAIGNAKGEDLTLDVNRTNCQIKFENFALNQNAYVSDLAIYGNVDMSKTPMLGSFSLNGTKYEAADIFEEDNTGKQIATINISKVNTLITEDNPLTNIVADNGTIKSTTYTTTGEGAAQKTVVTIVVATDDDEATYELTVGFKPDFTLTYYDVDGTTQLGTQAVEQDATITTFSEDAASKVTVAEGKKFRGWASSLKKDEIKYTEDDQIKGDINLYAVVTDIETANDTARYDFNLQKEGFCAADHESFVLNDNTQAGWHDANHGWVFKASDTIKILLGGKGYVKFGLCSYSQGTITLTSPNGNVVGTLNAKGSKDGAVGIIKNTLSEKGTYTISFSEGSYYFHDMSVVNETQDTYGQEGNWFTVVPGDGNSFISALEMANYNATQTKERSYVFVSDGVYDLGDKCLTTISGDNISIVGQSMENTIIMNTPTEEGIGITATLYNTSTGLYLQDLTLKNAYPYDAGNTGRAVCLQDKGTNTICKNVKMLSYQDTYYSNNNSGKYYFEDSDIHGIVDFICGGGDAFFNKCTLTLEPGKNSYITAPYTNGTEYGYVFDGCKIVGTESNKFDFGRAWGGTAKCAFLNTVLDANAAKNISSTRWSTGGMNVLPENFWEYNTLDEAGNVISPAENTVKFTYKTDSIKYNTILTAENAAKFSLDKVFSTWKPAELAAQKTVSDVKLEDNKLTWTGDADYYMILRNGVPFDIVTTTEYDVTNLSPETSEEVSQAKRKAAATVWGVRAANSMGGFGEAAYSGTTAIKAISGSSADTVSAVYYSVDGQQLAQPKSGVNIVVKTLADGTKKTEKVIVK